MYCLSYWDWYDDVRNLISWFREAAERVYQRHASRSWQASEVTKATAMAEDVDRPDEKPRPPAGGNYKQLTSQN